MDTNYLFYDIETTGLNKCFDQVLQFAAIRTDPALQEIERHEIRITLNPDVIPAPEAILTHRIGIKTMQQGVAESEGIQKIHSLFNTPGTISLGYNTLGFDDEFLRFSFYRNLLPPYTHQFNHHCGRMDLYPITVLYAIFNKEALHWPIQNNRKSLKLEHLNEANQLAQGPSHQALSDVEATIALARRLSQHTEMWNYACGYFQKNIDTERLNSLPYSLSISEKQFQEGLLVLGKLGQDANFIAPVMYLGPHWHYRNQTLWLRLDLDDLTRVTESSVAEHSFVFKKRLAEQPFLLPVKPRFLSALSHERQAITEKNRSWLKENPKILSRIAQHYQNYTYPLVPKTDPYAALYNSDFPSKTEEKLYQDFHKAQKEEKESIAEKFTDPLRKILAMRLLARDYPTYLSQKNQLFYGEFQRNIFFEKTAPVDFRNESHLTPREALDQIEKIPKNSLDTQQQELLEELTNYLTNRLSSQIY